jgi:hypothetical protein
MKRAAAAVGLTVLGLGGAGCGRTPGGVEASSSDGRTATAALDGRVMVQCGAGHQPIVRQLRGPGEQVAQVECVPASGLPAVFDVDGNLVAGGAGGPVHLAPAEAAPPIRVARIARRAPERVVQRQAPATRRRTWKKSATIVGGTTAGGAVIGALIDGKKGAAIGAGTGLLAGAVYDIATRDKR